MIGLTLSGRYELLARVGGGGMALVYKARDLLLNRLVAVKVLRQQFTHDEDFVKRFRREAQAAASLSHPNIVSIYDVGQVEDTHYIVMEFIDGANLNEIIRERAPLQTEEAVKIAAQISDALEHAHLNQIIHRDIKPHNILIGNNGRVKVTDFGIARAVTSSTLTQTGSVIGSVHYFSPEHAKGVSTGEKSDIYSLGIVLYQMLTGRLPFLGESPISVALKHLQDSFEQPRKVNPHIPQSVENIIMKAMRKNPQERYQSAREMLLDLETSLQPRRLNEAPLYFNSDEDDEADRTRVIPALRPDMRNTMEAPAIGRNDDEDRWNSQGLEDRKRRWIVPTVLGVLAVILIGVLIWAVTALRGQMSPADVKVPTVIGDQEQVAVQKFVTAGLIVEEPITYKPSATVEKGVVLDQSKKDVEVKKGSAVALTVSTGKELSVMPDLSGLTFDDAKQQLIDMGVKGEILPSETFDKSEPGTVLNQFPKPNEQFDPETGAVTLTISKGEESFPMPSLIGKKEIEARAIIEKYNLKLPDANVTMEPSFAPKGTVFKQFPADANEMVVPQTEVSIWISSGYPSDSRTEALSVTVPPAVEGQESLIKIMYSDATGDNIELGQPKKITAATTFDLTLILSPDKDGEIFIYRDGELFKDEKFPYNAIPASGTEATSNGDPNANTNGNGGTNPDEGSDFVVPLT
jgi:serine/threonine protein kinase/beta-lactam-binding protein with PASTA domain